MSKSKSTKKPLKPNGYVIFEDSARVIIATGFRRKSNNPKTGNMIQIWILARNVAPLRAIQTGKDAVICGDCPLRGTRGKQRSCYVRVNQAPTGIWKAYKRGSYPVLPDVALFTGRSVRFGAYGDPVFIPFDLLKSIAETSAGWTGYTHQWRNPLFAQYRRFVMASTEDTASTRLAQSLSWRTFRVSPIGELRAQSNEVICPNTTRGITCADCGLCAGTSRDAKSIVIEAHGIGARNL